LIFFASFLSKWHEQIKTTNWQVIKPLGALAVVALLILAEPDLGTTAVICISVMAMMFLAGIKIWQCSIMATFAGGAFYALIIFTPWRLERLRTFLNPWEYQFDQGYQLSQSLIGFGRGEWLGLGLGRSIQKLSFLPEAHTDFIFAIVAEEFGFIGALVVLCLFSLLVVKAFVLARRAIQQDKDFACYAASGIGVMFACQVFINIGVASGMLPTKGLTLPFISYGGSSLIVSLMMIGLMIRIQKELQVKLKPIDQVTRA
jgi:cell division protein FtsW